MKNLTQTQLRHLRGLAHGLTPIVTVGAAGLTDSVIEELDASLQHHELLKVKIRSDDRESRGAVIQDIEQRLGAVVVQRIGHTATFFRRNRKKPRITLSA